MQSDTYTINPVLHDGSYIKVLRAGNSESELMQMAGFLEKYSEQGFRVVQSFYENKGVAPTEGNFTIIMEYDQVYMDRCFDINKKERG